MKKIIILLWMFCLVTIGYGQEQGIRFETSGLDKVLAKAKKAGKCVFIDCYTGWCGPCKTMAKEVFTDAGVADYFNSTFVNYKLDMEKGEGLDVRKRYGVSAFPTFLFLDGDGKLMYKAVGVKRPEAFIAAAKEVFDDQNVLKLGAVYSRHLQDSAFMYRYFSKLKEARMTDELQVAVTDYLKAMNPEQYLQPAVWMLVQEYVHDYRSPVVKYLLDHRPAFFEAFGKCEVTGYVMNLYWARYRELSGAELAGTEQLEDFITEVKTLQMTFIPALLSRLYVLKYYSSHDLPRLAESLNDLFTYSFLSSDDTDETDLKVMLVMEMGLYCKALTRDNRKDDNPDIVKWFSALMEMDRALEYRIACISTLYDVLRQSGDSSLIAGTGLRKDQLMKEYYRQYPPTREGIEASKGMMDRKQYENMLKEIERLGVKIID